MSDLKDHVKAQYQRMHALLEANQAETAQMLENTFSMYVRKNSQQALQLNEKRQETEKLLSSVQMFCQRSDSINFMKVKNGISLPRLSMRVPSHRRTENIQRLEMFDSICSHRIECWICNNT